MYTRFMFIAGQKHNYKNIHYVYFDIQHISCSRLVLAPYLQCDQCGLGNLSTKNDTIMIVPKFLMRSLLDCQIVYFCWYHNWIDTGSGMWNKCMGYYSTSVCQLTPVPKNLPQRKWLMLLLRSYLRKLHPVSIIIFWVTVNGANQVIQLAFNITKN